MKDRVNRDKRGKREESERKPEKEAPSTQLCRDKRVIGC